MATAPRTVKRKAAAKGGTLTFRAAMLRKPAVSRDIEVDAGQSLAHLAEAIVGSVGFNLDHAFGFYSGLADGTMWQAQPKYELFADVGEPSEGALSVERTRITTAFPRPGHRMLFLFDYGDEWRFEVELIGSGEKVARQRYPRVVAKKGVAPEQYAAFDEDD